jgi:hypothetical protein
LGLSIYDAQSRLLGLAGYESDVRFPRSTLHTLTGGVADDVDEQLRKLADAGGFDRSTQASPWAEARVMNADEVQDLTDHLYTLLSKELPETGRRLRRIVEQTGLRSPRSLREWEQALGLLDALSRLLSEHTAAVFEVEESELQQLVGATASRVWRREQGVPIALGSLAALCARLGICGVTDSEAGQRCTRDSSWSPRCGSSGELPRSTMPLRGFPSPRSCRLRSRRTKTCAAD